VVSLLAYAKFGGGWAFFALFFFAPDLSFPGYLACPKFGAVSYNCAHSLIGALAVLAVGVSLPESVAVTVGFIWSAHIGLKADIALKRPSTEAALHFPGGNTRVAGLAL
jgi:hypothetical protein